MSSPVVEIDKLVAMFLVQAGWFRLTQGKPAGTWAKIDKIGECVAREGGRLWKEEFKHAQDQADMYSRDVSRALEGSGQCARGIEEGGS